MEKAFWSKFSGDGKFVRGERFWKDSFLNIDYNAVADLGNFSILLGDPSPSGDAGYVCALCGEKVVLEHLPLISQNTYLSVLCREIVPQRERSEKVWWGTEDTFQVSLS